MANVAVATQPMADAKITIPRVPFSIASQVFGGLHAGSAEVVACARDHGQQHRWSEVFVEDYPREQDCLLIAICARCYVRRCDAPVQLDKEWSSCMHPIGHESAHRDRTGYWREIGEVA